MSSEKFELTKFRLARISSTHTDFVVGMFVEVWSIMIRVMTVFQPRMKFL